MSQDILFQVSIWALPVLIAITFHEAAHGWMASRLGDDTARLRGRVTFNPIRHIDPVGTVLLPGLLLATVGFAFGWAKPVPVNVRRLRNPRRDMVLVALAGPGINLLLAFGCAVGFVLMGMYAPPGDLSAWIATNLRNAVIINVILAIFNMMPVPPLDGGRVAVGILPRRLALPLARLERWGLVIVLVTFIAVPMLARETGRGDIDPFRWLVLEPAIWTIDAIYATAFALT